LLIIDPNGGIPAPAVGHVAAATNIIQSLNWDFSPDFEALQAVTKE
jgi:hypothetical protein